MKIPAWVPKGFGTIHVVSNAKKKKEKEGKKSMICDTCKKDVTMDHMIKMEKGYAHDVCAIRFVRL